VEIKGGGTSERNKERNIRKPEIFFEQKVAKATKQKKEDEKRGKLEEQEELHKGKTKRCFFAWWPPLLFLVNFFSLRITKRNQQLNNQH
jgi:hypothetical protein